MYLNRASVIGNVGNDPEIRRTQNGDKVANFSVATTKRYKDSNGNKKESTEWHRVVVWGGLAEVIEKYVKKGSPVHVEGELRTRKWDNNGTDMYTTEIVLSGPGSVFNLLPSGDKSQNQGQTQQTSQSQPSMDDLDDDIPF